MMVRPKRGRVALVGHAQWNTYMYPETGMPRHWRFDWPTDATLAQRHLTLANYQAMYATQDGRCAICKAAREPLGLVIDHNHSTGKVRGLLCSGCNTGLGLFQDSPDMLEVAMEYLEERGCYGPNALAEGEGA